MKLRYEAACGSDQGLVRGNNEDNLFFGGTVLEEEHAAFPVTDAAMEVDTDAARKRGFTVAVFDGVGGAADGQVASFTAAAAYKALLAAADAAGSVEAFLRRAAVSVSEAVAAEAEKRRSGMGTTGVFMAFAGDAYAVCNVGDSRAFLLRGRELSQLSRDHTDAAALKRLGITDRKPRLTQFLGMREDGAAVEPYVASGAVSPGDQYLLCSDGLTDMVSQDEIEYIMQKTPTARACAEGLIAAALNHGGRDNVTVVVVRVQAV